MIINNQEIAIKPLPIKRYAELLEILDTIPELINEITNTPDEEVISKLPKFIRQNLNEFIKIVSIGLGIALEEVEQYSLLDIVKAVQEIIIVNQFTEVWEEIKKVIPLIVKPKTAINEIPAKTE